MKKVKFICEQYVDMLGILIAVLTVFSSFFITGLFGMGKYGTLINYTLCGLFFVYIGMLLIIRKKNSCFYKSVEFYICLFLFFYLLTIGLNTGKIQNLKIFILTAIQWVILFHYMKIKRITMEKVLYCLNIIIFIVTFIGIVYCFLFNHPVSNFAERHCGFYENPNTGAIICAISIAISMMFLSFKNIWNRVFLIINIVCQLMMIRLCLSRAGVIMLIAFLILYALIVACYHKKKAITAIRNLIVVAVVFLFIYNVVSPKLYHLRDLILYQPSAVLNVLQKEETAGSNVSKRDEKKATDSDNHRMNLLISGSKAFLHNPIIGVGQANLPKAVNEQMLLQDLETGGVHNAYLQMLISNGTIGFVSYAAIYVVLLILFIKKRKTITLAMIQDKNYNYFCGFTALTLSLFVYGLLESVIVLSSSFPAVIMAISAGGVASFIEGNESVGKELSTNGKETVEYHHTCI